MMIRVRTPPPMYIVSSSFRSLVDVHRVYPVSQSPNRAGVAELVDAAGLGPVGSQGP